MMPCVALRLFIIPPTALLTDHQPHGDGLVAYGFVRELAARGHELHVAAGGLDLAAASPPGVHLHPTGAGGGPRGRALAMHRTRRLLRRLAAATPFDLVHQLNPVDVGLSLAVAGSGLPVVLGPYVPDWAPAGAGADAVVSPATLRVKRALRAAQQRRARIVLLSSPEAATKVEASWPAGLRVREVPPGIDTGRWHPLAQPQESQDVLFLANLQVRKGVLVMLDAFERLAAQLPAARLLVAGAGPEEAEVRRRVAASRSGGRVELLGHVGREGVLPLMQRCAVYCLPSYGEPFGMTALEAMACARPVVATRAGGLQHLVDDRGGRTVPPGDAPALATALAELLADPGLRAAMGEHNRGRVEERYAWSRVADRLEGAYGEALASA
jgi:glycosyltransferase involved in cell wall biosynthesis